jgi:hypothetical protein
MFYYLVRLSQVWLCYLAAGNWSQQLEVGSWKLEVGGWKLVIEILTFDF